MATLFRKSAIAEKAANHSGAMLALWPFRVDARKIAIRNGEPSDELHVTLLFFGKAADLAPEDIERIRSIANYIATTNPPIEATLGGLGRFYTPDEDGNHAFYTSVDAPTLPSIRQTIANSLQGLFKDNHGFSPHMTLAYVKEDQPNPIDAWEPISLTFGAISLSLGDEVEDFPFTGAGDKAIEGILDDVDLWESFRTEVRRVATPMFLSAFLTGAEAAVHIKPSGYAREKAEAAPQYLNIDIDTINDAADQYVATYTNTWLQQLERSTRDQLTSAIRIMHTEGHDIQYVIDVAKRLFGPERAQTIAVTETTNMFGQGAVEAYKAAGLDEWEWQTVADPWVDEKCASLNHQRFPVTTDFRSAHPRCRCFSRPVIPEGVSIVEVEPTPIREVGAHNYLPNAEGKGIAATSRGFSKINMGGGKHTPEEWKSFVAETLGTRMETYVKNNPDLLAKFEKWYKVGYGPRGMFGRYSGGGTARFWNFADSNLQLWAQTSADNNPLALVMQKAAAQEFGLPLNRIDDLLNATSDLHRAFQMNASQLYDEFGDVYRAWARVQYTYTQEQLAAAGIKELTLVRGQGLPASLFPDIASRGIIEAGSAYTNQITLQPLSSFSYSVKTANSFSGSNYGSSLRSLSLVKVKAEQVFGSFKTGFGCLNESEIVLLGGEQAVPSHTFVGWNAQATKAADLDVLLAGVRGVP